MSVREVQTAAARVLHVDRMSDTAMQEMKSRFRYHPLDLEALFSVPVEPMFSTYGDYAFVTLFWPDAVTQDVHELRFFLDKQQLTIIGDTTQKDVAAFVATLHDDLGSPTSQETAPELVHDLLQRLRQSWPATQNNLTTIVRSRLTGNAQVIRQLGRWLQSTHQATVVPQLIIDAHALDSLAERPQRSAEPMAVAPNQSLPSLLRGYAVASAVMVVIVVATLAMQ